MYGLAGYRHTPGMPYLSALDAQANRRTAAKAAKGKAGQRPLRNKDSKERYKDKKAKHG